MALIMEMRDERISFFILIFSTKKKITAGNG